MANTDEALTPEALRQHLEMMLINKGVKKLAIKSLVKITAMWAYNQGLKARDSVKASDKL